MKKKEKLKETIKTELYSFGLYGKVTKNNDEESLNNPTIYNRTVSTSGTHKGQGDDRTLGNTDPYGINYASDLRFDKGDIYYFGQSHNNGKFLT